MLAETALVPLALFAGLMLAGALHALAASGHFPREHRAAALDSGPGRIVLFGSIAVTAVCMLTGIIMGLHLIPWFAAVIAGGAAVLAAPLALRQFPDRFVDGPGALLSFAAWEALSAIVLVQIASDGAAGS